MEGLPRREREAFSYGEVGHAPVNHRPEKTLHVRFLAFSKYVLGWVDENDH